LETGLASALEQPKQRHAFVSTGSVAYDDDDSMMRFRRFELQKVVPVASHEYATCLLGESENRLVQGIAGEGFAEQYDIMAKLSNK
jgi:hypothetical protein